MPIIRPGDKSTDTSDTSYDDYLEGTEGYFEQETGKLEDRQEQSGRISRGALAYKDRMSNVAIGRLSKEYDIRGEKLKAKDAVEYTEAEEARPVYSGIGALDQNTKLSEWVEKYQNVLGRGEDRYTKEAEFLEGQESDIKVGIVKEESTPYGLGRDASSIISDTTGKYKVTETYETGEPKKVIENPIKYISNKRRSGRSPATFSYGTYTPYEATLNKDGTIKSEINRDIAPVSDRWYSDDKYTSKYYKPIVQGVLEYTDKGIPKTLTGTGTYRSEYYQSPSSSTERSSYKTYEASKITFDDKGNILNKAVYDDAPSSSIGGHFGGSYRRKPYLKTSYDFDVGEKINFSEPRSRVTHTKEYQQKIDNALNKINKTSGSVVAWYNPYKGKGRSSTGQYYTTKGPTISKLKGPNTAVKSTVTNKWTSWKINPYTNKEFTSGKEYKNFWGGMSGKVISLKERQKSYNTFKNNDFIIPPGYWGTTSEEFGEVDISGNVIKNPGQLKAGEYFWYDKKK